MYNGDMDLVIDTSAIIAVMANEPEKQAILEYIADSTPVAPRSVHWEIGNALSRMFKRDRITIAESKIALSEYGLMRFRFIDVDLEQSLELSEQLDIYAYDAYDAYVLVSAFNHRLPLLTLDRGMAVAASRIGIHVLEVNR